MARAARARASRLNRFLTMRLLYLTPTSPVPTNAGNKTLTAGLLRYLTPEHTCDLVVIEDPSRDPATVRRTLRSAFPELRAIEVFNSPTARRRRAALVVALLRLRHPGLVRFQSRALSEWLRQHVTANAYDVVHFDMMRMAQY